MSPNFIADTIQGKVKPSSVIPTIIVESILVDKGILMDFDISTENNLFLFVNKEELSIQCFKQPKKPIQQILKFD